MNHTPRPLPTLRSRASGVLLHPTSLPGPHGIGDLGPEAFRFVDQLREAGQSWWQMLPIGPPGKANSPYDASSAFAGSPLLISLERLADEQLLDRDDLGTADGASGDRVDFRTAARFKIERLRRARRNFERRAAPAMRGEFDQFRSENAGWLPDFALFCSLKKKTPRAVWASWPEAIRTRKRRALVEVRRTHAEEIAFHEFVQFQFARQWAALRQHCKQRGVGLIGDLPIFVALESADVWAHSELFTIGRSGEPATVAGVGPDYFCKTGQLWGNPLYRWNVIREHDYDWWVERFRTMFTRFDATRLDHFIGFHRYWEIPGDAKTAETGRWRDGPGAELFDAVRIRLGELDIIAEDLGVVTPAVKALRDQFQFPGMRVLQFAFGNDPEALNYQPHNYPKHAVVYTGTHDNDTSVGWFEDTGSGSSTRSATDIAEEHAFALDYMASSGREIHWDMIRLAMLSVANTVIIPAQDLLGLGSSARMNRPGRAKGNWEWRMRGDALSSKLLKRLARLTEVYGRSSR